MSVAEHPQSNHTTVLTPGGVLPLTELALQIAPLPAAEVRSGTPGAGSLAVDAGPGLDIGVWEMTAGTAVDVEVDECFLVLTGRATVTVLPDTDGGSPRVMELAPGVLGRLSAGMRTEWVVHENLRKLYLMPLTTASAAPEAPVAGATVR